MRVLALLVAVCSLGGCTVANPEYCDDRVGCAGGFLCDLDGTLSSDGRRNVCVRQVSCESDPGSCVAPTPICSAGLCVECTGPADCSVPGRNVCDEGACRACEMDPECLAPGQPYCVSASCVECRTFADCDSGEVCAAGACRGCQADDECASEVCDLATGLCLPSDAPIAYVATSGAGTMCTREAPCDTLAEGLTRAKELGSAAWVHLRPGTYTQSVAVADQTVAIGGQGAELRPAGPGTTAVIAVGSNASVRLERVRVTGGMSVAGPTLSCTGVFDLTTLTSGLTLRGVEVTQNLGIGVQTSDCVVTIERSLISDNMRGGVDLFRSNFALVNNYLVRNGRTGTDAAASILGGVSLRSSPLNPGDTARFEFNTVVANEIKDNVNGAAVICDAPSGTITLRSSILYDNFGPSQVSAICALAYSDVSQAGVTGLGVMNTPPQLDAAFRLTATSPVINMADPSADVTIDHDGQSRSGRADMGADEYVP